MPSISAIIQKLSSPCKANLAERTAIQTVLEEMRIDKRIKNSRPGLTRSGSGVSVCASPVADAEGAMEADQSLVHVDLMDSISAQLVLIMERQWKARLIRKKNFKVLFCIKGSVCVPGGGGHTKDMLCFFLSRWLLLVSLG
jgi:hypothetical protein